MCRRTTQGGSNMLTPEERIDFWIDALGLDSTEVWGLIEKQCEHLGVPVDYALAEDLL